MFSLLSYIHYFSCQAPKICPTNAILQTSIAMDIIDTICLFKFTFMFSVCRQSSHIFQVTRGMYCTNNKVFLSQENAYMGTFQWILRNEGWFLYVSYSHLVPLVDLPCRNCTSSSTYFIQNPWTCTLQQNTFWSLGAMLRLTTCRRPVLLQA